MSWEVDDIGIKHCCRSSGAPAAPPVVVGALAPSRRNLCGNWHGACAGRAAAAHKWTVIVHAELKDLWCRIADKWFSLPTTGLSCSNYCLQ